MDESLDVVYYSAPFPSSWRSLATLALVFDKVHFPGVYMGTEGLDEAAAVREIDRIRSGLPAQMPVEDLHLLNCALVACQHKYIKEFCVFPGTFGVCGTLEPGAEELLMAMEAQYFGPPPPGFHPAPSIGFAKGLPGLDKRGINAPSWLCYPANAFLYAARLGFAYVNDDPQMPILVPRNISPKNNAEMLSAALAIECVSLALPSVKELKPPEIQELRDRTRDDVQPFRRAILRLTKSVNDAITADASTDEVVHAAQFVARSEVQPELEELRKRLTDPARHWTERLIDIAGPPAVLMSATSSWPATIAATLGSLLVHLRAEARAQREKEREIRRSGLHYLLKLQGK